MPDCLFVYGTLRPGHVPPDMQPFVDRLTPLRTATVRGTLHHFPEYPALLLDSAGPVDGLLLRLPADPNLLAVLDDHESFDPTALPHLNLFRREIVEVTDDRGAVTRAFTYVYNQPLPAVG